MSNSDIQEMLLYPAVGTVALFGVRVSVKGIGAGIRKGIPEAVIWSVFMLVMSAALFVVTGIFFIKLIDRE